MPTKPAGLRTRWSAVGAAVAVSLGAGGIGLTHAASSGERPVTITVSPERILDTRSNLGLSGRFTDAAPRDLRVTGPVPVASGGTATVVPADAVAVLVNVTVVSPTHDGFLSLRPRGASGVPTTSTVNFTPGSIEPNAATVDLDGGRIQVWVETSSDAGTADVLIDVVGYTIDHTHEGVGGISVVDGSFPMPDGDFGSQGTPLCPVGQIAVAGGMRTNVGAVDPGPDAITHASHPNPATSYRNWIIEYNNSFGLDLEPTTYTVCADTTP